MLQPNHIPQREPEIDVGIILPGDHFREFSVVVPPVPQYNLFHSDHENIHLSPQTELLFYRSGGGIEAHLPDGQTKFAEEFHIAPETQIDLRQKSGLLVYSVIAGRNFHWQKKIDVYYPGAIRISIRIDNLILINRLPFEQYVACVATSEMSAACPQAFLQAQMVAARSWMLANVEQKHRDLGMDVCNDDCCQRYQGSSFLTEQAISAARATYGRVLLFDDKICDARYSKSCGGMMEAFETVWPGEAHPYLQVKPDAQNHENTLQVDLRAEVHFQRWLDEAPQAFCSPHFVPENELKKYLGTVDEKGKYFRWEFSISQEELTALLNKNLDLQAWQIKVLQPLARGGSGRVTMLRVGYLDSNGKLSEKIISGEYNIRADLHERFLFSSAIVIAAKPINADVPKFFHIRGCGWGHGVGLCQIGALGMALAGKTSTEILEHYYPSADLQKIY